MTWRSIVWWLVGLPITFGLMLAPCSILAVLVIPAAYMVEIDWRLPYSITTLASALAVSVWLVCGVITYKEEII
jgi:hypothetical protein